LGSEENLLAGGKRGWGGTVILVLPADGDIEFHEAVESQKEIYIKIVICEWIKYHFS